MPGRFDNYTFGRDDSVDTTSKPATFKAEFNLFMICLR
jgi:hypothetical protein